MNNRNKLRHLLHEVLRSDADLDAFCLDFFPSVAQRFSAGMDRIQKVNLLFQIVDDPQQIVQSLRQFESSLVAKMVPLDTLLHRSTKWTRFHMLFSAFLLLLICLLGSRPITLDILHNDKAITHSRSPGQYAITMPADDAKSSAQYSTGSQSDRESNQDDSHAQVSSTIAASRILFGKLPHVASLIGREEELAQLDAAWEGPTRRHAVSVVAIGGQGKTSLVVHWLLRMSKSGYRGARRVFFWSFYNQGTSDRWTTSSDEFMAAALQFFGDRASTTGHPFDKAYRLARLLKRERSLLVLDGLEPLQYPPRDPALEGHLSDQALTVLLQNLAVDNPGMVVVTSRVKLADLQVFEDHGAVQTIWLRPLSDDNGVHLLRQLGVQGPRQELVKAVHKAMGHPLTLTLLGNLLRDAHGGDIHQLGQVDLGISVEGNASQAQRTMAAYDKWFGPGPEQAVIRLLGLFDRFAPTDALQALRTGPVVPNLNESLVTLKQTEWNQVIARLRRAGLVEESSSPAVLTVDTHPLVREYFGEALRRENESAWREGHRRLYAWYAATAKDLPTTPDEAEPLYAAVQHGCRAGLYKESLNEIFERRIRHGNDHYSINKLGAFGADLSAMANFFVEPWTEPLPTLDRHSRSSVLFHASYALRGLGRMKEALVPMRQVLKLAKSEGIRGWATTRASNLSEVELALGLLHDAVISAQQGVSFADELNEKIVRQIMHKSTDQQIERRIKFLKERWVISRTTLADALHQQGRIEESLSVFIDAEAFQSEREPTFPILHGLEGYQYCDLLLTMGRIEEVLSRAARLAARKATDDPLLAVAMNIFSIGRAYLAGFGAGDLTHAALAHHYLNEGVTRLRESGYQDYLAYSLTHRAAFFRQSRDFLAASRDLDEALLIGIRGDMLLAQVDAHLERTRLLLAQSHIKAAREELQQAQTIIQKTGYHRRDGETLALTRQFDKPLVVSGPVENEFARSAPLTPEKNVQAAKPAFP